MAQITENSLQQIDNILTEALDAPTNKIKRDNLKPLIDKLKKIKEEADNHYLFLQSYGKTIDRYEKLGMAKESAIVQAFTTGKYENKIEKEREKMKNLILLQYQVVNKIRKKLTNQTITYIIGSGNEENQSGIIEAHVTFDELKEYLRFNSTKYTVHILASTKNVSKMIANQQGEEEKLKEDMEEFISGASTLYSAVYRYYQKRRLDPNQKKASWGHMYQAYRLLLAISKDGNKWKPQTNTIKKAFSRVLSGGGKGGSFSAGGDVLSYQVKSGIHENPDLISFNSTSNAITDLVIALEEYINSNNKKALKKMLIRSHGSEKIFKQAHKKATKYLDNILK